MSKRLQLVFYILSCLYVILIIVNWYSFYIFGLKYSVENINWIYQIVLLIIAFFIFRKKNYILPISFAYMTFKLLTMPILGISIYGYLGAIKIMFLDLINGFYQPFLFAFTSWLIPIASLVGCIYWYLDVKKSKSLDKHWSE
ncbi:hypothetical protein [Francisella philomiragia]|uniref:hypothetical protein n=1 Tax=Francisella philomiragia TaxID=28110 RepID=UPI001903FE69|nr:hypothetical protein [Francisella philomiragia]MBK2267382.1 hypothetical protein [Francisella philomiragia]MBK2278838.1 hypothetical protein [Francisella philomiragia]MBK2286922.1 hypothetical protein [Francisella philomiragia]MBK2288670.1 hypothetical protein [Francisella philomiragia]MBK2290388.1 hypothetical protein [Francisella philomiragia]